MDATLILSDWIIAGANHKPRQGWGVRIKDDIIDDIGTHKYLLERYPEDPVWNAAGQVLSPGFVNAHTHLYGVLAHGIPLVKAPTGFMSFLVDFWWPLVEDRLDHQMINAATDLQCARMIHSGVTTFYDCEEAPYALPGILKSQAEVVRKHGLRALLSFEATERVSPENGQLGLKENAELISDTAGELVSGLMCFHTTFTCSAEFIQQAFALADKLGSLVHMHCSEGAYEPEHALKTFGMRPIAYYDSLGAAGTNMLASQCVQVSEEEIGLMAERGVRMVHMPLSNCEVGGGIAPVPDLIEAGVTVGLGSDGYIDDFFEVLRGAFLIHKAHKQDPGVMPAHLVWQLATEGGARALGLEKVGRIEKGWQADLQLIDGQFPTPVKEWNLLDQLVLYRHQCDVRSVVVAGEVLMRDGKLLRVEEEQLFTSAHYAAEKLWSEAHSNERDTNG
jgi:5-methylthioadenosine/S-adenosylhomocysteine deaminase